MKTPIEVLYAEWLVKDESVKYGCPVVRYSDHCAVAESLVKKCDKLLAGLNSANASNKTLLREVEQLTATCERLQAELRVAKYSQQATNEMIANIPSGRWDTKPKAL